MALPRALPPKLRLSFLLLGSFWIWPPQVILPSQAGSLAEYSQALVVSLHESAVQALASSQLRAGPEHTPFVQVSPLGPVQNWPSSQAVPLGFFTSAGQDALVPVQLSAASHWPEG